MQYLRFLEQLHALLEPRDYLEIGIRVGNSLALARHRAVGVDPDFQIKTELNCRVELHRTSSDAFFKGLADNERFDMVFVDGLHLFEYALRDVMNAADHLKPSGIVVIDDVMPTSREMATREHNTFQWTGDVWKVPHVIAREAPEVSLHLIDTRPTGLAVIRPREGQLGVLRERYDALLEEFSNDDVSVPDAVLERRGAVPARKALDLLAPALAPQNRSGRSRP